MLPPTIAENNAYLSRFAYEKALRDAEAAKQDGYVKVPDWFPVPTPGYEYRIFGQMLVYMKPKPKLRHWLRHRFHPILSWKSRRFARMFLREPWQRPEDR